MTTEIRLDVPRGHYRPKHIARAELAKIVTLRSTAITVGLTVVACLLVTGLVTHAALHHGPGFYQGFDPTQVSLTGMITVALTGGVFGALLITGEYSSGTIRTTLAAVPKRALLLATKLGLITALTMVFCVVLSFFSFFLGKISSDTITQQSMPDDFRGRAFALYDIAYNIGFIVPAIILSMIWVEGSASRTRLILMVSGAVFIVLTALIGVWARSRRAEFALQDDLVVEDVRA